MAADQRIVAPSSLVRPDAPARTGDRRHRARVQTYALVMAIILGLAILLRWIGPPPPPTTRHPWWWVVNLVHLAAFVGLFLHVRRRGAYAELLAGLLHASALTFITYRAVLDLELFAPGPSYNFVWLCVLVVAYPLLVGGSALPHILLIGYALVLFPGLEAILSLLAGRLLGGTEFFSLMITLFLVGMLAGLASVIVRGFVRDVQQLDRRVREMGGYRLVRRIGRGGMGEVWTAEHSLLKRPAAIKLVQPRKLAKSAKDPAHREEILRRFQREAQVTAQLSSPHTVRLFDFGVTEDETFFYVMELLDGVDLEYLVLRTGPLPPGRAIYLLRQLCKSLAEAHEAGLVHRDIKPANVFACHIGLDYDFVKVLDFGLVIRRPFGNDPGDTRLTGSGMVTGTPDFMSPEQALDDRLDHRSDIYAFGCLAYWLVTGKTLFDYPEAIKTLNAHVREQPEPVDRRSPNELPRGLVELVERCLQKRPDDRPPSVEVVEATLAQLAIDCRWNNEDARRWWAEHGAGLGPEAPAASGHA